MKLAYLIFIPLFVALTSCDSSDDPDPEPSLVILEDSFSETEVAGELRIPVTIANDGLTLEKVSIIIDDNLNSEITDVSKFDDQVTINLLEQKQYEVEITAMFSSDVTATDSIMINIGSTINVPTDFNTIQAAIDSAMDGELILVENGTYNENITILNKRIGIASKYSQTGDKNDIQNTIIDGQGESVFTVTDSDGSKIVGLTITNGEDAISTNSKLYISHNIIDSNIDGIDYEGGGGFALNNTLTNNTDDAIDFDGSTAALVKNNILKDNLDDGIEIRLHEYAGDTLEIIITENSIINSGEDGIQIIDYPDVSDRNITISRNIIANTTMAAIGLMPDGITIEDYQGAPIPEPINIFNNTIVANNYGITGGANLRAINNIISDTTNIALKNQTADSIVSHNLLWNNGTDVENSNTQSDTLVTADPILSVEYVPGAGSPAIDAGTTTITVGDDQILVVGDAYFSDSTPDIGAKEVSE